MTARPLSDHLACADLPVFGHLHLVDQPMANKISAHRRRPVPMAEVGPGLRREDDGWIPRRMIRVHLNI